MTSSDDLELCFLCARPTGRAGRGDDSLFGDDDTGPYCPDCWDRYTTRRDSPDLNTCPGCGGPADNGHDRCYPPSPYYCAACSAGSPRPPSADEVDRAWTNTQIWRFWEKVRIGGNVGDCWIWTAGKSSEGYGRFHYKPGVILSPHRITFEWWRGYLPDGHHIDHLCRNPSCVNPLHLEAVTPRENTMRGISPIARQARLTHCKRGHEFTKENTMIDKNGKRRCRVCLYAHTKARRERLRKVKHG